MFMSSPERMKQNLHIGVGAPIRGLFLGWFIVGGYKCEPRFVAPVCRTGLAYASRTGSHRFAYLSTMPRHPAPRPKASWERQTLCPWQNTHLAWISQTVAKAIGMRSMSWGYSWLSRSAGVGTGRGPIEGSIKCRLTGSTFSSFPLELICKYVKVNEDSRAEHHR